MYHVSAQGVDEHMINVHLLLLLLTWCFTHSPPVRLYQGEAIRS